MFAIKNTPLQEAGVLHKIIADYITGNESLKPFYDHYPDKKGFNDFFESNNYSLNREELFSILSLQSSSVENTSDATRKNIELLKTNTSYTVTTGHQLCLFTGPLYVIYKIFSAINLAEELNTLFPGKKFIPVYWAATEDHDFEEINHFNAFGKTVTWESAQKGAVGNFKTKELETAFVAAKEIFGNSDNGHFLTELFENAYLKHSTLAAATRFLVNTLFGSYGLVTVDGNDKLFKSQFKKHFKKDIFDNIAFEKVNCSIEQLKEKGYEAQVNPRPINCFYIEPELRARVEKEGEVFKVVGTDKTFTAEELHKLIENESEKISPNVVLRPLYQQTILPNIAYVGGPGELAYWLEYKDMFVEFNVIFPVLVPRTFVTIIEKNVKSKIDKLGFEISDLAKDEQELIRLFQVKSDILFELDTQKESVLNLYKSIAEKIEGVDKTLTGAVNAEHQKVLNGLDTIVGKANRALKQKSETEINQLKAVKEKLFPNKIPQERFDNFSGVYIRFGDSLMKALKENIHPLSFQHVSVIEE
ncbi:MAG: bacillithiol biosynthesis cysteine-adding enzyme BshC [Bacteroidetes bacterium]|nr:bacillithiol biosynthesis cysteine-adding enzyme BshC [Bacteroidota bacterium]